MRPRGRPSRANGTPRYRYQGPVHDLPQTPDRLWKRIYVRAAEEDLERFYNFRPGGYMPVDLQDEFNNGQYRVIHKLGHGGFATVWLCEDQHAKTFSYVAIKILIASEIEKDYCNELLFAEKLKIQGEKGAGGQEYLCMPLKDFISQSPNGSHICLVYPVLGPTVEKAAIIFSDDTNAAGPLQEISRQTVAALATLHSRGICHAGRPTPPPILLSILMESLDFRPSNVLLSLRSLDGLDEDEVLSLLGEPEISEVHMRKDSHPTPAMPYAPKYLVFAVDFTDVDIPDISTAIKIIDFGQAFDISEAVPTVFGLPVDYAPPEVVLDSIGTISMDLWSLGCTLYEIRIGKKLFEVFQLIALRKHDYVIEVATLLGPPPDRWMEYYEESDERSGEELGSNSAASDRISNGSIFEKLAGCHDCYEPCNHPKFQRISEAEALVFADLVEKLLRYEANERISAHEVLEHPWFHTRF